MSRTSGADPTGTIVASGDVLVPGTPPATIGTYVNADGDTIQVMTFPDTPIGGDPGEVLAFKKAGDAFPRCLILADTTIYLGDGTVDPLGNASLILFQAGTSETVVNQDARFNGSNTFVGGKLQAGSTVEFPNAVTIGGYDDEATVQAALFDTLGYGGIVLEGGHDNQGTWGAIVFSGGANQLPAGHLVCSFQDNHLGGITFLQRFAVQRTTTVLVNGGNNDVAMPATPYSVITGPTAAFTVTGIDAGSLPPTELDKAQNGSLVTLINLTGQNMTIAHENAGSAATNRITTMTGADITTVGNGNVQLWYDIGTNRWIALNVVS